MPVHVLRRRSGCAAERPYDNGDVAHVLEHRADAVRVADDALEPGILDPLSALGGPRRPAHRPALIGERAPKLGAKASATDDERPRHDARP